MNRGFTQIKEDKTSIKPEMIRVRKELTTKDRIKNMQVAALAGAEGKI